MSEHMGRIMGASLARGVDAYLTRKCDAIEAAYQQILFKRDGGDTEVN